jgi:hypothetical protein
MLDNVIRVIAYTATRFRQNLWNIIVTDFNRFYVSKMIDIVLIRGKSYRVHYSEFWTLR